MSRADKAGYMFPMLQLDASGPNYIQKKPHPYYQDQPIFWRKPYYQHYNQSITANKCSQFIAASNGGLGNNSGRIAPASAYSQTKFLYPYLNRY